MRFQGLSVVLATLALAQQSVRRYAVFTGSLTRSGALAPGRDPFNATCAVRLRGPPSSRYPDANVSAYFDGGSTWGFRFTPDALGQWRWSSDCPDEPGLDGQSGVVSCIESQLHGSVLRDPERPSRFVREDGSQYFLLGYEVDWLWALGLDNGDADAAFPTIWQFANVTSAYGFNHFIISFYANYSDWNKNMPARVAPKVSPTRTTPFSAGGGQAGSLDLRFYKQWDTVLAALQQHDVIAHVMLYVGNKNVAWPERLGAADETYWRYTLARFSAYPNLVWDVSKEAGSHGVGADYIRNRLALIHSMNPFGRLVTSHSGILWDNNCSDIDVEMCTVQKHFSNHTGGQWYDDMIELRQQSPGMPIFNAEFMYEAGRVRACNGSAGHDCVVDPADVATARMVMWDMYMAGGYAAWYYCDTAWDVITNIDATNVPTGYRYAQLLVDFWSGVGYPPMVPDDSRLAFADARVIGHCLADPDGSEFVVHARASNTNFTLDTGNPTGGSGPLEGEWYDPATGSRIPLSSSVSRGHASFTPPSSFDEDVVLHIFETRG